MANGEVFNFNVGILGHVDSGKTSLAKALSQVASTAAFDKHPESQRRGITIDLGFSSFLAPVTPELVQRDSRFGEYAWVQFTLVDCPGHSTLLKTVIGGSQIVDMILLVVDATKGIQTQTAECIVLADIVCPGRMLVATNKVDLLADDEELSKMEKRIRKALQTTTFAACPILPTNALQGERDAVKPLVDAFCAQVYIPDRQEVAKPFIFFVDHCFSIKGRGTVMTGTVISGSTNHGSVVDIPALNQTRAIKSIQIFRRPVQRIVQGDRAAICMQQLERLPFERGIICEKGALKLSSASIASVSKVKYYKYPVESRLKFHVSMGYELIICECFFFTCIPAQCQCLSDGFNFQSDYTWLENVEVLPDSTCHVYVLMQFNHGVFCSPQSRYIASKLDIDTSASVCRIAFHGRTLHLFHDKDFQPKNVADLKVYKMKCRQGIVERIVDDHALIMRNMFGKGVKMEPYLGCEVTLSTGETGHIESPFGLSGKTKVYLPNGLMPTTRQKVENRTAGDDMVRVNLRFKRLTFRNEKKVIQ